MRSKQWCACTASRGKRLSYPIGLPTSAAYNALGVPAYWSPVFSLVPKTAGDFYRAGATKDHSKTGCPVDHDFQLPYLDIRNREHVYAVSMFKADASL